MATKRKKARGTDSARVDLGRRVKERREALDLSQAELAAKAGMDQAYISHIESGKYSSGIDTIGKIAAALDLEVAALLTDKKSSKKP